MANFLDNFSGTSGTNLTAHTSDSGNTYTAIGNSIVLDGNGGAYNSLTGGNFGLYKTNWTASTYDQYGYTLNLLSTIATSGAGVIFRFTGTSVSSSSFYLLRADPGTGYSLYRAVNNAYTQLGSEYTTHLPANNDALLVTAQTVGSTVVITAILNGTQIFNYTDSSGSALTAAGSFGLWVYGDGATTSTGPHVKALTATSLPILSVSLSGTPGVSVSAALSITTPVFGTAPYTCQFQRAPDSSGSPGTYANVGTGSTATTYTDATLTPGSVYWYQCVVTDSSGTPIVTTTPGVRVLARPPATYYFAAAGSDSNTGLSSGSPWQTVAKMNSYGLVAGDTFQLNGGDTFAGNFLVSVPSGGIAPSQGAPVTIQSYGTGQGVISAGNSYGIYAANLNGVLINNLTVTGSGVTYTNTSGAGPTAVGYVTYTSSSTNGQGIWLSNTGSTQLTGCVINNCTVSGFYNGIALIGNGLTTTSGKGFTGARVTNNVVSQCANADFMFQNSFAGEYTALAAFLDCYVAGNNFGTAYGTYNGTSGTNSGYPCQVVNSTGTVVERNAFHDSGAACASGGGGPCGLIFVSSTNCIARANEIYNISAGHSGVDATGVDFDGSCVNCIVEGNYIHDLAGSAIEQGSSVGTSTGNVARFNCAARCNLSNLGGGLVKIFGGAVLTLHNNTVYHSSSAGPCVISQSFDGPVNLYNNVFICDGTGVAFTSGTGLTAASVLSGNVYDARNGAMFSLTVNGTAYTTLAALQAAGYEVVNGLPTGVVGSSSLSSPGTAPTTGTLPTAQVATLTNFDPTVGSAAINGGLDVQGLYAMTGQTDFHGAPCRYQPSATSSGYDIGAVKYGGGALLAPGLPAASAVQSGVTFGSAGNSFTGTYSGVGGGSGGGGRLSLGL